ncbi:hypothetical protein [Sphingomonas sanxanigenens]|uniref:hypothetical protein n=1 Tax=Sphingomonas sanxanigenens TaxID=397260 RepID=UPI00130115E4|nr:hypothetical protein [Sphingomonas sanxanigenens]
MIALLLALQLAGQPSEPAIADLTQRQLDEISTECGTPKRWLREGPSVRFRPSPSAKYAQIDCILIRLKRDGYAGPVGIIGNETSDRDQPR